MRNNKMLFYTTLSFFAFIASASYISPIQNCTANQNSFECTISDNYLCSNNTKLELNFQSNTCNNGNNEYWFCTTQRCQIDKMIVPVTVTSLIPVTVPVTTTNTVTTTLPVTTTNTVTTTFSTTTTDTMSIISTSFVMFTLTQFNILTNTVSMISCIPTSTGNRDITLSFPIPTPSSTSTGNRDISLTLPPFTSPASTPPPITTTSVLIHIPSPCPDELPFPTDTTVMPTNTRGIIFNLTSISTTVSTTTSVNTTRISSLFTPTSIITTPCPNATVTGNSTLTSSMTSFLYNTSNSASSTVTSTSTGLLQLKR